LADPSKNLMDQQRRQQEQQQKMSQDYLRRQQMHVYYQSQQQKKQDQNKVVSCSVCGSVLLIKSCPFCRRFFCSTHFPFVKLGSNGHQCVTGKPVAKKLAQPQIPPKAPTATQLGDDALDETLDWLERGGEDDDSEF